MSSVHSAILTVVLLALSACSTTLDADKAVTRGAGPDADGFLVIGAGNDNARNEVFYVSQSFGLNLVRDDGRTVDVGRNGCNTTSTIFSTQTCASDKQVSERVVQLPPGDWQIASIFEVARRGFPARVDVVRAKLPPGIRIHVGPGEIVYAGDFLFHLDQDAVAGTLKSYGRDDAAAAAALVPYPGLTGGFVYREPTHPVAGRS